MSVAEGGESACHEGAVETFHRATMVLAARGMKLVGDTSIRGVLGESRVTELAPTVTAEDPGQVTRPGFKVAPEVMEIL